MESNDSKVFLVAFVAFCFLVLSYCSFLLLFNSFKLFKAKTICRQLAESSASSTSFRADAIRWKSGKREEKKLISQIEINNTLFLL